MLKSNGNRQSNDEVICQRVRLVWTGGYNVSTKEARNHHHTLTVPPLILIEDIHLGGETEMGNEVSSINGSGVMSLVKKILVPFFNTFNMDRTR